MGMSSRSGRIMRVVVAAMIAVGLLSVAMPAHAVVVLKCEGNGQTIVTPGEGDGPQEWSAQIEGVCSGDTQGPYVWLGLVEGTSNGSGRCGPGLFVNDLSLNVVNFLLSQSNTEKFSKLILETWTGPLELPTLYPTITPFTSSGVATKLFNGRPVGDVVGVGAFATRLLRCPGTGGNDGTVTHTIRIIL